MNLAIKINRLVKKKKAEKDAQRNILKVDLSRQLTEKLAYLSEYYEVPKSDVVEALLTFADYMLYDGLFSLDGKRTPVKMKSPIRPDYEIRVPELITLKALKTKMRPEWKDQKRTIDPWGRPMYLSKVFDWPSISMQDNMESTRNVSAWQGRAVADSWKNLDTRNE